MTLLEHAFEILALVVMVLFFCLLAVGALLDVRDDYRGRGWRR